MAVNQEAYALEMSLISKNAIINAWEKYNQDKTAESIERLKQDGEVQVWKNWESITIGCKCSIRGVIVSSLQLTYMLMTVSRF